MQLDWEEGYKQMGAIFITTFCQPIGIFITVCWWPILRRPVFSGPSARRRSTIPVFPHLSKTTLNLKKVVTKIPIGWQKVVIKFSPLTRWYHL